ncbi:unnamed protein product [Rotaria magnacalcarata]|uniref:Uncharacterized protein n=9 Tax=Rotaria magnacalcarata TaxID=392030 RepID=A0A816NGD1_9BILA|nr:unnamed protein product [Rotaria magnacalcarata]CAF2031557.1 unnamed protein product [Rotaria magnacalcarata]
MNKMIGFLLVLLLISSTKQLNIETCRYPMGIETGKILDSAFSSSSHARESTIASKARIRSETDGWCPLNIVSSTTYEYIQIDLVNLTVITLIELQGRFTLTPNEQFADAFRIEYRRYNEQKWIKYKDFSGRYMLNGNSNSYIPAMRNILPSIIARQIRIIPIVTGPLSRHICMRLELYGCSYRDGLISYSMPQGDKRGFDSQFFDETYDGQNDNGALTDGLGQLTDGIIGHDDYRSMDNSQGIGQTGYDWIGWKRKSPFVSSINLIFHFDSIRNFTSIHIHTSNLYTRDIYLFHSITITNCQKRSTRYNHQIYSIISNDYINTSARFIHVAFADRKTSIISNCLNVILTYNNRSKWILISEVQFDSVPIDRNIPQLITLKDVYYRQPGVVDVDISNVHLWHWIMFGSSLILLFIASLVYTYIRWSQTYDQGSKFYSVANNLKIGSTYRAISPMGSCISPSNTSCLSSNSNNDIRHNLIISASNSSRSMNNSDFSATTMSTIYQSSSIDPYLTATSIDTSNLTTDRYSSIDMYTSSLSDTTIGTENKIKNIQGPCGNNTYESLFPLNETQSTIFIPRVSNKDLIIEQSYSTINGSFGTMLHGYLYLNHPNEHLKRILIKILTTDDVDQKELFDREHLLLNDLTHPNLVQFYGYTIEQNYALIEHSDLNNLFAYLSTSKNTSKNIRLHFLTQLSNALRYLESHHIIHRDIAARNCLIYPNYKIKLTNSAMASEQFQLHYCRINHIQLPVRWMAPESISSNEFTSQSDIWSFGITLWEVMTNCNTLPYALLNDEQVYQRLKSTKGLHLPKPECLSKEFIDLMLECWRPCNERPKFQEIFTFLNRRLYGMDIV